MRLRREKQTSESAEKVDAREPDFRSFRDEDIAKHQALSLNERIRRQAAMMLPSKRGRSDR